MTRLKAEWLSHYHAEHGTPLRARVFAAIHQINQIGSALAPVSGWLTRLAGALGIIAFALFAIGVYRVPGGQLIDAGAWICVAGSALALVGGFFRVPRATVSTGPTVVPAQTTGVRESS